MERGTIESTVSPADCPATSTVTTLTGDGTSRNRARSSSPATLES
jgi:hypothetical protein